MDNRPIRDQYLRDKASKDVNSNGKNFLIFIYDLVYSMELS